MADYSEIKKEISELITDGEKLHKALRQAEEGTCEDIDTFLAHYEVWYSKALHTVHQLLPARLADFTSLYSNPKRKEITYETYCISDALRIIEDPLGFFGPWNARLCVKRQVDIVSACLDRFDSKLYDIQTIVQADIFDSEIESAKHLQKMGFLRAAGAICGVIIEKHFAGVCQNRNISLKKKSPTIADYNEVLKDVAYDTIEWRKVQRLADLRNLCDHSKGREPTKEELDELISGTEHVIKTIF